MKQSAKYYQKKKVGIPFTEAVARTRQALSDEGFGILSEIDVSATLRKKLQVDFRPYTILGACNPPLARQALTAERDIGVLLPCNVVVYEGDDPGESVIAAVDPEVSLGRVGNAELEPLASKVKESLSRVLAAAAGRGTLMKAIALAVALSGSAFAQGVPNARTIHVYGPGGPLPAMQEAAAEFSRLRGVKVEVVGGPTAQWLEKAKSDADVIFSGAEHMMTDFIGQLKDAPVGQIDVATVDPLYVRPSAILVRPGNPKRIRLFEDLLRPGIKILVVQGAGQTGMWEDMAGRTGDIAVVRALRRNIGSVASNSGDAKKLWTADKSYDAWLIWNIWQVANPELADVVPVAPKWRIYRDCGTALTIGGRDKAEARDFVSFLRSRAGARIFARWGWMTRK
jgi:accessory colonization factor AcfC